MPVDECIYMGRLYLTEARYATQHIVVTDMGESGNTGISALKSLFAVSVISDLISIGWLNGRHSLILSWAGLSI